jgi:hypothetical protein
MNVRFSFMKGTGILEESARTDGGGTATSRIERVSGLRSKFIIESVPVVMAESEQVRIEELRYNFIVSNIGDDDSPYFEDISDIVQESVDVSLEFLEQLLESIFGEE